MTMLSVASGITQWAQWYLPPGNSAYTHNYNLYAYVDTFLTPRPNNTHYRVYANGHNQPVTKHGYLNQNVNHTGYCYQLSDSTGNPLPPQYLNSYNSPMVDVVDATGTAGRIITVDVFCFRVA